MRQSLDTLEHMVSCNVKGLLERETGDWQVREGVSEGKRKQGGATHRPSFPASIPVVPFHQQKTVCTIAAHEGTLAAITFNASGSKLASASEKVSALSVFTGSPPGW